MTERYDALWINGRIGLRAGWFTDASSLHPATAALFDGNSIVGWHKQ
jgi:hypothetical protein